MTAVLDTILRNKAATSMRSTADRIVRTFEMATPEQVQQGCKWYGLGGKVVHDLANRGHISLDRAAVVIAHMSPQTSWQRNVAGAYSLVLRDEAPGCIKRNADRARAALMADDPWDSFGENALKTRCFAMNLLGRVDVVTVDIWGVRVALGKGWGKQWRQDKAVDNELDLIMGRSGVYVALEWAFKRAAKRIGMPAPHVQATTWIVARNGRAA